MSRPRCGVQPEVGSCSVQHRGRRRQGRCKCEFARGHFQIMNSSDSTTLAQEIIVKMAGQSIIYHTGFKTTLQTPTYRGNMCEIYTRHESDHCLPLHYLQTFWKFLKVKNHFLLIFDLKTIIFPLDDAKLSKFQNEYLLSHNLSNICEVICKKT